MVCLGLMWCVKHMCMCDAMCLHSFAFEDMQDWHVVRWQFCFEAMLSDDLDGVMESSALTASASGLRCLGSIMQFLKICSWLELCG